MSERQATHNAIRQIINRRQGKDGFRIFVHQRYAGKRISHLMGVPLAVRRRDKSASYPGNQNKFPILDDLVKIEFVICRPWHDIDDPLRPGNILTRCGDCHSWIQHGPHVRDGLTVLCPLCAERRLGDA